MSKVKNLLNFLLNLRLYILLCLVVGMFVLKQETKANKHEQKSGEKICLNSYQYSSFSYSMDTNDAEKTITAVGIICVLPNGKILHVIMTGENIDGRMKDTEETISFLAKHQDEIFNDLARTIVEAGKKSLPPENKKEKTPDMAIKKKV